MQKRVARVVFVLLLILSYPLAASPIKQKLHLQDVTVFLRGAQLFSSSSINLPAGDSEVILWPVAGNINLQSLSLSADNGVVILSTAHQSDFLADEIDSPEITQIKNQIEQAKKHQAELQIQLAIAKEQLAVLADNRTLAREKSSTTATEVGRMLDLVEKRMLSALTLQSKMEEEITKNKEKITKLEQQLLEQEGKNQRPGGQILVKLYSEKPVSSKIGMSYVIRDAGWSPVYDIRVEKIGAPIHLSYKALVFQQSGIDWKNVNLTLSTANPSIRNQMPPLSPQHLKIIEPRPATPDMAVMAAAPVERVEEKVFLTAKKPPVRQQALDNYVVTNADGVNTSFDITLPYTIPSDGKTHVVMVKSANLDGIYRYVSTPKLDPGAFLQAQIGRWEDLHLLAGKTSIYFEDAFVGEGFINPKQRENDVLEVALGRDNKILLKREIDQNFKKTPSFFGNQVEQQYAYHITVKNTRNEAVKLVVFDQTPVSQDSEIMIEVKHDGAERNEETGVIHWNLELAPREERKLFFSYTVSYPKEKRVNGL